MVFSRVLAVLTVGDRVKIIKDVGLASISLFGMLIAVLIGTGLVYKEIDKKTIYTLLAKPIERWQFLLGKFLGLVLTLFVLTAAMALVFLVVVLAHTSGVGRAARPGRGLHLPGAHPDHGRGHAVLLLLDADPEFRLHAGVLSSSATSPGACRP